MPKFSVFVRDLHVNPVLATKINAHMVASDAVAPGQLRYHGEWYYLTYLKTIVTKNFNPVTFDVDSTEVSQIRACCFKMLQPTPERSGRLIVRGSKGDIKEIATFFEALANPLTSETMQMQDLFRIVEREVDLGNILSDLEKKSVVDTVKKIRLKKVEIKLGRIDNCIVNTEDYGAVTSLLAGGEESGVFGIEVFLKDPQKTSIYYDTDGQIRVSTKNQEADPEKLTIEYASA